MNIQKWKNAGEWLAYQDLGYLKEYVDKVFSIECLTQSNLYLGYIPGSAKSWIYTRHVCGDKNEYAISLNNAGKMFFLTADDSTKWIQSETVSSKHNRFIHAPENYATWSLTLVRSFCLDSDNAIYLRNFYVPKRCIDLHNNSNAIGTPISNQYNQYSSDNRRKWMINLETAFAHPYNSIIHPKFVDKNIAIVYINNGKYYGLKMDSSNVPQFEQFTYSDSTIVNYMKWSFNYYDYLYNTTTKRYVKVANFSTEGDKLTSRTLSSFNHVGSSRGYRFGINMSGILFNTEHFEWKCYVDPNDLYLKKTRYITNASKFTLYTKADDGSIVICNPVDDKWYVHQHKYGFNPHAIQLPCLYKKTEESNPLYPQYTKVKHSQLKKIKRYVPYNILEELNQKQFAISVTISNSKLYLNNRTLTFDSSTDNIENYLFTYDVVTDSIKTHSGSYLYIANDNLVLSSTNHTNIKYTHNALIYIQSQNNIYYNLQYDSTTNSFMTTPLQNAQHIIPIHIYTYTSSVLSTTPYTSFWNFTYDTEDYSLPDSAIKHLSNNIYRGVATSNGMIHKVLATTDNTNTTASTSSINTIHLNRTANIDFKESIRNLQIPIEAFEFHAESAPSQIAYNSFYDGDCYFIEYPSNIGICWQTFWVTPTKLDLSERIYNFCGCRSKDGTENHVYWLTESKLYLYDAVNDLAQGANNKYILSEKSLTYSLIDSSAVLHNRCLVTTRDKNVCIYSAYNTGLYITFININRSVTAERFFNIGDTKIFGSVYAQYDQFNDNGGYFISAVLINNELYTIRTDILKDYLDIEIFKISSFNTNALIACQNNTMLNCQFMENYAGNTPRSSSQILVIQSDKSYVSDDFGKTFKQYNINPSCSHTSHSNPLTLTYGDGIYLVTYPDDILYSFDGIRFESIHQNISLYPESTHTSYGDGMFIIISTDNTNCIKYKLMRHDFDNKIIEKPLYSYKHLKNLLKYHNNYMLVDRHPFNDTVMELAYATYSDYYHKFYFLVHVDAATLITIFRTSDGITFDKIEFTGTEPVDKEKYRRGIVAYLKYIILGSYNSIVITDNDFQNYEIIPNVVPAPYHIYSIHVINDYVFLGISSNYVPGKMRYRHISRIYERSEWDIFTPIADIQQVAIQYMATDGKEIVCGGGGESSDGSGKGALIYSTNHMTEFHNITKSDTSQNISGLAYGDGKFIFMRNNDSTEVYILTYNTDRTSASIKTVLINSSVPRNYRSIVYVDGVFITCMHGGAFLALSHDGEIWTLHDRHSNRTRRTMCSGGGMLLIAPYSWTGGAHETYSNEIESIPTSAFGRIDYYILDFAVHGSNIATVSFNTFFLNFEPIVEFALNLRHVKYYPLIDAFIAFGNSYIYHIYDIKTKSIYSVYNDRDIGEIVDILIKHYPDASTTSAIVVFNRNDASIGIHITKVSDLYVQSEQRCYKRNDYYSYPSNQSVEILPRTTATSVTSNEFNTDYIITCDNTLSTHTPRLIYRQGTTNHFNEENSKLPYSLYYLLNSYNDYNNSNGDAPLQHIYGWNSYLWSRISNTAAGLHQIGEATHNLNTNWIKAANNKNSRAENYYDGIPVLYIGDNQINSDWTAGQSFGAEAGHLELDPTIHLYDIISLNKVFYICGSKKTLMFGCNIPFMKYIHLPEFNELDDNIDFIKLDYNSTNNDIYILASNGAVYEFNVMFNYIVNAYDPKYMKNTKTPKRLNTIVGYNKESIWTSDDRGIHWTRTYHNPDLELTFLRHDDNYPVIFCGTKSNILLYSFDGHEWNQMKPLPKLSNGTQLYCCGVVVETLNNNRISTILSESVTYNDNEVVYGYDYYASDWTSDWINVPLYDTSYKICRPTRIFDKYNITCLRYSKYDGSMLCLCYYISKNYSGNGSGVGVWKKEKDGNYKPLINKADHTWSDAVAYGIGCWQVSGVGQCYFCQQDGVHDDFASEGTGYTSDIYNKSLGYITIDDEYDDYTKGQIKYATGAIKDDLYGESNYLFVSCTGDGTRKRYVNLEQAIRRVRCYNKMAFVVCDKRTIYICTDAASNIYKYKDNTKFNNIPFNVEFADVLYNGYDFTLLTDHGETCNVDLLAASAFVGTGDTNTNTFITSYDNDVVYSITWDTFDSSPDQSIPTPKVKVDFGRPFTKLKYTKLKDGSDYLIGCSADGKIYKNGTIISTSGTKNIRDIDITKANDGTLMYMYSSSTGNDLDDIPYYVNQYGSSESDNYISSGYYNMRSITHFPNFDVCLFSRSMSNKYIGEIVNNKGKIYINSERNGIAILDPVLTNDYLYIACQNDILRIKSADLLNTGIITAKSILYSDEPVNGDSDILSLLQLNSVTSMAYGKDFSNSLFLTVGDSIYKIYNNTISKCYEDRKIPDIRVKLLYDGSIVLYGRAPQIQQIYSGGWTGSLYPYDEDSMPSGITYTDMFYNFYAMLALDNNKVWHAMHIK